MNHLIEDAVVDILFHVSRGGISPEFLRDRLRDLTIAERNPLANALESVEKYLPADVILANRKLTADAKTDRA